jgi:hypothetical protein
MPETLEVLIILIAPVVVFKAISLSSYSTTLFHQTKLIFSLKVLESNSTHVQFIIKLLIELLSNTDHVNIIEIHSTSSLSL